MSHLSEPYLSVIVIVFNMRREAPRTLHSLSAAYQRDIRPEDYEVIVVENGSTEPLPKDVIDALGPTFLYVYHDTQSPSPVEAANRGVAMARGGTVMLCLDGARILTPGLLSQALRAQRALAPQPAFVTTLAWHLGPGVQADSLKHGYDREQEDRLLEGIDWKNNGYDLFTISAFAPSSAKGWFATPVESSCYALPKKEYTRLGGLDERFQTSGGGLANLDFFRRAIASEDMAYVTLLGEGTFHQMHDGASTNAPSDRWSEFHAEYMSIRGEPFYPLNRTPTLIGSVPEQCLPFLRLSIERASDKSEDNRHER